MWKGCASIVDMARKSTAQLNIRSETARRLVAELVAETGKSATQIVEDAICTYRPQRTSERPLPLGMEVVDGFLVMRPRGAVITLEDTNRAIEADRNRDPWHDTED